MDVHLGRCTRKEKTEKKESGGSSEHGHAAP